MGRKPCSRVLYHPNLPLTEVPQAAPSAGAIPNAGSAVQNQATPPNRVTELASRSLIIANGLLYQAVGSASMSLLRSATDATMTVVNKIITQRELRNNSGAVLREVQAGHIIIVTRNGTPVAELRPVPARRFVPRAVLADAAQRAPRVDAAQFRSDLDAVVDPSVDV